MGGYQAKMSMATGSVNIEVRDMAGSVTAQVEQPLRRNVGDLKRIILEECKQTLSNDEALDLMFGEAALEDGKNLAQCACVAGAQVMMTAIVRGLTEEELQERQERALGALARTQIGRKMGGKPRKLSEMIEVMLEGRHLSGAQTDATRRRRVLLLFLTAAVCAMQDHCPLSWAASPTCGTCMSLRTSSPVRPNFKI